MTARTGSEALFLGGDPEQPCGPAADCAVDYVARGVSTGAAYDLARGT